MLFSRKYTIAIPEPCHEDWSKMTPVQQGRFCASCSKNVVDYTNFTEKQINEAMRNNSGRMCGRFRGDQLEKVYTLKPQIRVSSEKRFFQYALSVIMGIFGMNKINAQTDTTKTIQNDSLSLVSADSTLMDTVALAQTDTLNLRPDSIVFKWEPGICGSELVVSDTIIWTTVGFMGVVCQKPVYDPLLVPAFIPEAFDTLKKFIVRKRELKDDLEIAVNPFPDNKKEPLKDKPELSDAVLPEEWRRKSEIERG